MPTVNPTRMTYRMPTQRVDATPIDGPLAANFYVDSVNILAMPGSLNPGGEYTVLFADLGWQPTPGTTHVLYLTALEGDLESAPSASVEVRFVGEPSPPTFLDVS